MGGTCFRICTREMGLSQMRSRKRIYVRSELEFNEQNRFVYRHGPADRIDRGASCARGSSDLGSDCGSVRVFFSHLGPPRRSLCLNSPIFSRVDTPRRPQYEWLWVQNGPRAGCDRRTSLGNSVFGKSVSYKNGHALRVNRTAYKDADSWSGA